MTAIASRLRGYGIWAAAWLGTLALGFAGAKELPTLAGPTMGTTYRVTLARDVPGMSRGTVHREVEAVLARLDRALSTWRADSDASRFNRAAVGEWVEVADDLVAVVQIAAAVHAESGGAFDITVAPGGSGRPVGMQYVELRTDPPALAKAVEGVALDCGGIGPGYAVDAIGAKLVELGSTDHLVEVGGEVRAWGRRPDGGAWRVLLRGAGRTDSTVITLADGEAVATSTARPGKSPVDPRTGRVSAGATRCATVHGRSCAVADAWAVAALVLQMHNDVRLDDRGQPFAREGQATRSGHP